MKRQQLTFEKIRVRKRIEDHGEALARFAHRGFSERTIRVLVDHGIDAPEQLLFASMALLSILDGVGSAIIQEITKYRAQYLKSK